MYYIGTKMDCLAYNDQVTLGEKYKSYTVRWENVVRNENGPGFAILKHDNYESDMTLVDSLPDTWFKDSAL
jgi:hypothetical protein